MCCVVVCDLETSRMGAPYIYDVSHLRVKSLSYNLRIGQIFVTCGYLPSCGNSVLAQILPRVLFPPTVYKCNTSQTNRRCLFCFQFQTSLQIRIFVKSVSHGKSLANVHLTSCVMYNYGRIFQVHRKWDN